MEIYKYNLLDCIISFFQYFDIKILNEHFIS